MSTLKPMSNGPLYSSTVTGRPNYFCTVKGKRQPEQFASKGWASINKYIQERGTVFCSWPWFASRGTEFCYTTSCIPVDRSFMGHYYPGIFRSPNFSSPWNACPFVLGKLSVLYWNIRLALCMSVPRPSRYSEQHSFNQDCCCLNQYTPVQGLVETSGFLLFFVLHSQNMTGTCCEAFCKHGKLAMSFCPCKI